MTQNRVPKQTYYSVLGLHPSASPMEIRRAYRELSKRYHPDTTNLPEAVARGKFQALNEAYSTLANPQRRLEYDARIRYSRIAVVQPQPYRDRGPSRPSPAYLDPRDRPLSGGEIAVLLALILTILACLGVAIAVAVFRGDPWVVPVPS